MATKASVPRRTLLAPRNKRKRSINEARSMIETRLHRAALHVKAAKQDLREIRELMVEFPSGTFDADISNSYASHNTL